MSTFTCQCHVCGAELVRKVQAASKNVLLHFCDNKCKAIHQKTFKPVTKEWLYEQYITKGLDTTQIAHMVKRDPKSVWNWLKDFGIPTRPRGGKTLPHSFQKGQKNPFEGRKHTPEARKRMSEYAKLIGRVPFDPKVGPYGKTHKGPNHHAWRGGITPERQSFICTQEWKDAVKAVKKRDKKTCQRCGRVNTRSCGTLFDVHHIVPFPCVELRTVVSNLIYFCAPCHDWIHSNANVNKEFIKEIPVSETNDQVITDDYAIYHGDCCEIAKSLPDESIGFSLYSPPFCGLFTYSSSERDMSNCRTYDEFFENYEFLVREIYRITPPGRLTGVHCMDVPSDGANTGGDLLDFPGDIIRLHKKIGWRHSARYHVWKEPLGVRNRTMAKGLAHRQVVEDSSLCDVASADYLLMFRKPGENKEPITHPTGLTSYAGSREMPAEILHYKNWPGKQTENRFSHWIWRMYASSFWDDVRIDRVLPYKEAREPEDEKHCLATGSLVLTRNGYRAIESINVGDEVLTHLGRWKPVVSKHMNGVRETVQVKAQGVPYLRLTPDHLMWCRSGTGPGRWSGAGSKFHPRKWAAKNNPEWVQAGDTKIHYLNLPLPPIEYSSLSESDWWIIGRYLGDGYMDARGYPHICCSTKEVTALRAKLGWHAGHTQQTNRSTMAIALKDSTPSIGVAGGRRTGELTAMLKKCGIGAAGKQLPPEAFALEPTKAECLLTGYLSADGHFVARHQRWMASSVSRGLLLGMAILAQRCRGVAASVYAGRAPGRKMIEGRDCNTLQDWVMNIPPHNLSGMILDDGAWKKVRDVQPCGSEEVWDIEVADDHSYVAEGCVVHNCHPLQLDVIERAVVLYSNPGDIVFTPFMGISSEVYGAVINGRKGVGCELKRSYYEQAKKNMASAVASRTEVPTQAGLFDSVDDTETESLFTE